ETAPGPGRSPTPSMVPLKVGGMQNTLASVAAAGDPPTVIAPAFEPVSVMVRTAWLPNAPDVCCLQEVHGAVPIAPHPVVIPAQSVSLVHATGGFLKIALTGSPQKPQKTRTWLGWSTEVFDGVPVVRRYGIGSWPIGINPGGGQSWLVGNCGPLTSSEA